MVKRHESLKKYIKTILDQLPQYIEAYTPEEQELLKEFLSIVAYYEEADFKRKKLSQRFEEYTKRIIKTNQYLNTPFLWFTERYLTTAKLMLNISNFHAKMFFEYLNKYLRGTSATPGVFQLIKRNHSLSDLIWEKLQYECTKLLYPLTNTEIQILESIYHNIEKIGFYVLDPYKLKDRVIKQLKIPSNAKTTTEMKHLFTILEATWFMRFHSPAFGLDRLFFQIQLKNTSSLQNLIDFQDKSNTVLNISDIYRIREKEKNYIGVFYVPSQNFDHLVAYMNKLEKEGKIIISYLEKIETRWFSLSLHQYKSDLGWFDPTKTKLKKIAQTMNSKTSGNRKRKIDLLYIPPSFNKKWHFYEHPLPLRLIELYCKIPNTYAYSDLPLGSYTKKQNSNLHEADIGLLKQMYYNQVLQIEFIPLGLVYDYSIDLYHIRIPNNKKHQLKPFLALLPYSEFIETDQNVQIWTRLSDTIKQWIEKDLMWQVQPMIRDQYTSNLDLKWFNKKELQWITPRILTN